MKNVRRTLLAIGILLSLPVAGQCGDSPTPAEKPAAAPPVKCLEAAVNPVTGHAVCVNPRGAPVDPPPVSALKPCKPRAHDKDGWTTYEHWSGC